MTFTAIELRLLSLSDRADGYRPRSARGVVRPGVAGAVGQPLTAMQRDNVIGALAAGQGVKTICRELGICEDRVRRELGLPNGRRPRTDRKRRT